MGIVITGSFAPLTLPSFDLESDLSEHSLAQHLDSVFSRLDDVAAIVEGAVWPAMPA